MAKINCEFALIDVKRGRHKLRKRLAKGERIRVSIVGVIDTDPRSFSDDGTSIEFQVKVESCKEM